jgi:growth hormone-inducible transmembrane protein
MSFTITLRGSPAALSRTVSQLTKSPAFRSSATRAFHYAAPKTNASISKRTTGLASSLVARNAFARAGSRSYQTQTQYTPVVEQGQSPWRKLIMGGAIFGGTLVAINAVFNRETREDGGMPPYEREYLNSTFLHTGLGIGIIGLTARQMINSGFVYRIMVTNPWVVAIGGIGLSFATMIATRSISPDKYAFPHFSRLIFKTNDF